MLSGMSRWRSRGVSLIEMMITITIVAIVLALSVPAVGEWLRNARIRTASESIQNALQLARAEAVRCNVPVEFILDPVNMSAWQVQFAYPNLPTPCRNSIPDAQWPVLQSRGADEGTVDVELAVTPATATTVTFDGLGRRMTANADATPVLTRVCVDLNPSLLEAAKTRDLELNIEAGGGVRMCDPKVTDASDTRICPDRVTSVCTGR